MAIEVKLRQQPRRIQPRRSDPGRQNVTPSVQVGPVIIRNVLNHARAAVASAERAKLLPASLPRQDALVISKHAPQDVLTKTPVDGIKRPRARDVTHDDRRRGTAPRRGPQQLASSFESSPIDSRDDALRSSIERRSDRGATGARLPLERCASMSEVFTRASTSCWASSEFAHTPANLRTYRPRRLLFIY